jgi:hypothetical protein
VVSDADIQMIREGYEAFARRDTDAMLANLHPEIEWRNPTDAVEPGTRHGHAGFRIAVERLADSIEYSAVEPEEIVEVADDTVVVTLHIGGQGKGSGAPFDQRFGHLVGLRDGKMISLEWFRSPEEAKAAVERSATDDSE